MSPEHVHIRELAGWGLDISEYRPDALDPERLECARRIISERVLQSTNALLDLETARLQDYLSTHAVRPDLGVEMEGLDWSFRLSIFVCFWPFNGDSYSIPPSRISWSLHRRTGTLVDLSFGPAKTVVYDLARCAETSSIILRSQGRTCIFASPTILLSSSPFMQGARSLR